jgi:alpha-mannosidase
LSLLNDSKYGYDAKDNVLRISLLRSPKWPDPNADMGRHEFVYSLYPHADSWKDAGTVRRGYELNYPLLPVPAQSHPGALPAAHSFVSLEPENLVLTALKRAEDGDAWILRFYEFAGKPTQARVRLPQTVGRAHEADLQEKVEKELPVKGSEVEFAVRPFEIKTLRLELPQEPRR